MTRALAVAALLAVCLASTAAQRQYRIVTGFDIPGNDIPSNGRSYTQVCIPDRSDYKGKLGFDAWKAYCDDTPGCVAAVAPVSPNGCAYLKAKGTRDVVRPDPNWVVMTTQASGGGGNGGGGYGGGGYGGGGSSGGNSGSTGNPGCAKFVGNGEKCTTNPWAAEQICCGGNHVKCNNGVCGSTFPSTTPAPQQPASNRQWSYLGSYDISGYDIPAPDGSAYTKFCTPSNGYKGRWGQDAFKLACDETPGCVAFTMSTKNSNGCAFLKTKGTRDVMLSNGDWVVMTTQASGGGGGYGGGGSSGGGSSGGNSGSTGNPGCAKFVGNGEKCTTNPWAAEQICCGGNHVKCNNGVCGSTFPSGRKLAM